MWGEGKLSCRSSGEKCSVCEEKNADSLVCNLKVLTDARPAPASPLPPSRNVSIRVVGLDCGGNFTFTSHFQTHLWSPLANDVALMCVEKKEDPWIGGRSSFPSPSHFLLPTGAEHFPLVLTSFFHRGVTSDLEFALTRLCSSQLFPQKSSPAQNWKVPHMC